MKSNRKRYIKGDRENRGAVIYIKYKVKSECEI